jgi:hypothetical protein
VSTSYWTTSADFATTTGANVSFTNTSVPVSLPDGSFPIRAVEDIDRAIDDLEFAVNRELAVAHIRKRAKELTGEDKLTRLEETDEMVPVWEGVLGVEGLVTDDGRYLIPGEITERELPLPLMAQFAIDKQHQGAKIAGKITEIWRQPNEELGENAVEIWGRGLFDEGDDGREAARLVEAEVLRGVSLDISMTHAALLDPETLEEIDPEALDLFDMLGGTYVNAFGGKIAGATLVPHPAIEQASMRIVADKQAVVASAFGMRIKRTVLTASAAGKTPLLPPREWFQMPEADRPTPLTVTDTGQVYGHLALWGQCHAGFAFCETPPRSRSEYAYFHLGEIGTAEGTTIPVGRLTVGESGKISSGHAAIVLGTQGAIKHYDDAGCVAAFVRAKDGKHGIWLSGAIRSDVPAERIRDLRANPPSGDWRWERGGLELVAVLSVPVPGFPIPRAEARVASAGGEEHVEALVASGYAENGAFKKRLDIRRRAVLSELAHEALTK